MSHRLASVSKGLNFRAVLSGASDRMQPFSLALRREISGLIVLRYYATGNVTVKRVSVLFEVTDKVPP